MTRTARILVAVVCVASVVPSGTNAAVTNVALNADVQLLGAPFFTGGWGYGLTVSQTTVVDGVFLAQSTQWDQGPVWWDSYDGQDRYIVIDLGGTYRIESFIVQADDNDAYELYYRDPGTDDWYSAWTVPWIGGWGMQTRPSPFDNTERYVLPGPIVSDAFMFWGVPVGDRYFSVSEIQAFGTPLVQVTIDIKPGSDPNCFNINGHGVVPVAVLGSTTLDVAQIDLESLLFAGLQVRVRGNRGPQCSYEFSNADTYLDLVCHFEDDSSLWEPGEAEACLSGRLLEEFEATPVEGCDSICIVP